MASPRGFTNIIGALIGGIAFLAGFVGVTSVPSTMQYPAAHLAVAANTAAPAADETTSLPSAGPAPANRQNSNERSSTAASSAPTATTTIVYRYVTDPAPETSSELALDGSGVSEAELTEKLQALDNKFASQIASITSAGSTMGSGGILNEIAASNKIDQLDGVTISNSTIDTASIPDLSGKYLALTGGTLTGALSIDGDLGIGTTSPASTLDITNSSATSSATISLRDPLGGLSLEIRAGTSTLDNVFIGVGAGAINTTGSTNVAVGYQALGLANTTGYSNVAVGYQALHSNTNGYYNVANGFEALGANTTGGANVANGFGTLGGNTSGYDNTANGWFTLFGNTAGYGNTADGYQALDGNVNENAPVPISTGSLNTAMGTNAIFANTTGWENTAIGVNALEWNIAGNNNLVLGANALGGSNATSTSYDIGFGYQAGYDLTSQGISSQGNNNIVIGNYVDAPSNTGSNQLNIGNLIYGTGIYSGSAMSSTPASGNVGIGTSTPYSRLSVWGPNTASTSAFAVVNSASTTVFAAYDNGNATYSGSLFQSSDQRLKTDIQSLDASSSLAQVEALNPVSYLRLDQPSQGQNLGFIAQAAQTIFPELVSTTSATALTPGGTLTLNYIGLIAPIVSAIKGIAEITGAFETNLIAWLGSTANGIHDLYASVIHAHEVIADELCAGSVCVNQQQLAALLAGQGAAAQGTSGAAASSTPISEATASSSPPIIQVDGDNPAVIYVGSTYADLGATITGPAPDLNLGIHVSVDGGATTTPDQITIDTSKPATHVIEYFATDQNGLTGYASRSVTMQAATSTSSHSPSETDLATSTPPIPSTDSGTTTASTTSTSTL